MRAALTAWLGLSLSTPAGAQAASSASFRFSAEAGAALKALWEESVEAHQERVACLAADVRGDTVFVSRVQRVSPEAADSMGVSATASIEQCGPPEWDGTVHTHVALYTDDSPSQRFSGQDRTAMQSGTSAGTPTASSASRTASRAPTARPTASWVACAPVLATFTSRSPDPS